MGKKHFGQVPGVNVGDWFPSRAALREAGLHAPLMSGIHGTAKDGADSIVVSGGYVDDEDAGDLIIYTGAGGNDAESKRQVASQSVRHPNNAGLITSQLLGYPVRVIRGRHPGSSFAPSSGFRYDGLFGVTDHWEDQGRDGFRIVRFRLEKLDDEAPQVGPARAERHDLNFRSTAVVRRIRDSAAGRRVKQWHNFRCQVCGTAIPVEDGRLYAESAYIRPLGRPHSGPDSPENILCLCPNHHAQLEAGGLAILSDLDVVERPTGRVLGRLRMDSRHRIDREQVSYRLEHLHPWTVEGKP